MRLTVPVSALLASVRQLAVLFKSGVPLAQALKILSAQTEHPALKTLWGSIQRDVEGGGRLSEALGRYPTVFSELFVNSVAAGETGGVLDEVLNRLADMLERDFELNAEIKAALRYPLIVTLALLGAVIFLMVAVVPRFASIYGHFQVGLPLPTRIMIAVSRFLFQGWILYVPAGVGGFFLLRWALSKPWGRSQWDRLKLRIPLFGDLILKMVIARFASLLAFLYANGLPILKALEVTSRAVGNVLVQQEIGRLSRSVSEGKGLSGGLGQGRIFPPLMVHMIAVGESSGKLAEMLEYLVEYYEREVRNVIRGLNALIEPLLTFALGVVVLGLALAIFLPMWNMSNLFRH